MTTNNIGQAKTRKIWTAVFAAVSLLALASAGGIYKLVRASDPKAHTHYTLKSSDAGTVRIEYASASWVGTRAVAKVEYEYRDGRVNTSLFAVAGCDSKDAVHQMAAFNVKGEPLPNSTVDWTPNGGQMVDVMAKAICALSGPK